MNQTEFSNLIGVSKGRTSNIITGKNNPDYDYLMRIASNVEGVDMSWLLTGNETVKKSLPMDLPKPLPFYDLHIFAGPVEVFLTDQPWLPDGIIYLPDVRLCDCALRVRGDSMAPVIENGDIIAVKLIQDMKGISWKKPYVIITDHHRLVKYLYKGEDEAHIILVSANRQYEPEVMSIQEVLFFYEVRTIIKEQHF